MKHQPQLEIVYPGPGAVVRHRTLVYVSTPRSDSPTTVYVQASDQRWYRQGPHFRFGDGISRCSAVIGFSENRSGWDYHLTALLAPGDQLAHVYDDLPKDVPHACPIRITRR